MNNRFRYVMLGVSLCLLVSISFGAGVTVAEPNADRLLTKAVNSLENEPVEAVNVMEITRPDGEMTQTVAIHKESANQGYLEIIDPDGSGVQQQVVVDGSTVWRQESDTTIRYTNSNREWLEEYRNIGTSPEVVSDHFNGQYKGTTMLDGREVHVVAATPPDETTTTLSLDIDAGNVDYEIPIHEATEREWYLSRETWWIDAETYYPIKQSVEWTDENGAIVATATQEYEELILDPASESGSGVDQEQMVVASEHYNISSRVDDIDLFEGVNPSANDTSTAESTNRSRQTGSTVLEPDVFQTQTAVNASVPFALPTLQTPDGFLFDRATVYSYNNTHTATLMFPDQNSDVTLTIQVSNGQSSLLRDSNPIYEEDLTDADGRLVVTESGTEIVHQCDTVTVRISGSPSAETLIELTRSLECH